MMLDGLVALIIGDANTNSLVGGNVFLSVLPRGYTLPAIAIHRYGATQDYDMGGPLGVREDQIQIDVYGPNASVAQQVSEYVRTLLVGYVGTLSDGTVVQACYLERFMDMPFLDNADSKGLASRSTLGFRVIATA